MTIEKKSLISSLSTTKKAIVASKPEAPAASTSQSRSSARKPARKPARMGPRKPARKF